MPPTPASTIAEADGRRLFGFVELDLGTMSHRQLKAKAAGYGEYARLEAWRHRNPFCPALLFITTSEKRARSFLAASDREIGSAGCWSPASGWPATFAAASSRPSGWSATASRPPTCSASSAPRVVPTTKRRRARKPSAARKRRSATGCALTPRPSPSACGGSFATAGESDQLGQPATDALRLSLEGEGGALNEIERAALEAVGGMLAEPIDARLADREPTPSEREALAALVAHHRASQLGRLDEAAGRFGEGPKVRQRRRWLEGGELLSADSAGRAAPRRRAGPRGRRRAGAPAGGLPALARGGGQAARQVARLHRPAPHRPRCLPRRGRPGRAAALLALRGDRLSRPRAQAPPWRSAPRCRALPFLRGGDAERAANRAGEIDLRSGRDGATPSGRIAARRRRDHEGRQHKTARSATSSPPCRLNTPSPDQRWTISFAASRPRRSSTCSPLSATDRLREGDTDATLRLVRTALDQGQAGPDALLSLPARDMRDESR